MSPESVEAPVSVCEQCSVALPPGALSCPSCHRLTHAPELERLASEANAATQSGDLTAAAAAWRKAISLLPDESLQHKSIEARIGELDSRIAAAEASAAGEQPSGQWKKW